jgi:hypothetical protein
MVGEVKCVKEGSVRGVRAGVRAGAWGGTSPETVGRVKIPI